MPAVAAREPVPVRGNGQAANGVAHATTPR
jgi:hypothetical protein